MGPGPRGWPPGATRAATRRPTRGAPGHGCPRRRAPPRRGGAELSAGLVRRWLLRAGPEHSYSLGMPALAVPARFRGGSDLDLEDARESLAYWERRAQTLPRTAVRRRREARAMAARWHERVALAEREAYGRGLLG